MSVSCRVVSGVFSCILAMLLFLSSVDSRPQFGLLDLFGAGELANGTSLLSALALAHIQHKVEKLLAFADLAEQFLNATATSGGIFG